VLEVHGAHGVRGDGGMGCMGGEGDVLEGWGDGAHAWLK
jgi:hypothetical protein